MPNRFTRTGALVGIGVLSSQSLLVLPNEANALSSGNVPPVGIPPATIPPVKVPPVAIPPVTVPPVHVPGGHSTPTVGTPTLSTTVSTPPVSTRALSTPTVPAIRSTVPHVGTPDLHHLGAPVAGPARPSRTISDGPSSSPASESSDPASASQAPVRLPRREARQHRTKAERRAAETRRLRSLVRRDRACLSSLPHEQARLLSLRAGVSGHPLSAEHVARLLKLSSRHEYRLEAVALRSLRTAAGHGCSSRAGVVTSGSIVIPPGHHLVPAPLGVTGGSSATSTGTATSAARRAPKAHRQQRAAVAGRRRGGKGPTLPHAVQVSGVGVTPSGSDSLSWILILVFAGGAAGLMLIPLAARRMRLSEPRFTSSTANIPVGPSLLLPPPRDEQVAPHYEVTVPGETPAGATDPVRRTNVLRAPPEPEPTSFASLLGAPLRLFSRRRRSRWY
jgi:hypothetical protein